MPEHGADAMPTSNSEYLRALKRNSATQLVTGPFSSAASEAIPNQKSDSSSGTEKRGNPRYKCEGSAEFRTEGFDVRTWARVTDLSRSGCYVEMQATSPLDAAVDLLIDVNGLRVHAKGIVKTSYPLLGMGIAFTEILDEDRMHLEEILRQLAGAAPPAAEPKSSGGPDLLMITDAGAALNAVAKFFQSNRSLTREEFTQLIGKSQNRNGGADL
jgi:hypothetical protein